MADALGGRIGTPVPGTAGNVPPPGGAVGGAAGPGPAVGFDNAPRTGSIFQLSDHPIALFFHTFFRSNAIGTYLFGFYMTQDFILTFIITILMLAFDFWTVKNVTGRLLVGLRWWSEVKADGKSEWIFESRTNQQQQNSTDSRVFWFSMYAFAAVWILFAILSLLSPTWLCLCIVAISLNVANVMGYMKCENDAKRRQGGGQSQTSLMNNLLGSATGARWLMKNMGLGGFSFLNGNRG